MCRPAGAHWAGGRQYIGRHVVIALGVSGLRVLAIFSGLCPLRAALRAMAAPMSELRL